MTDRNARMVALVLLLVAGLQIAACGRGPAAPAKTTKNEPAKVERAAGGPSRLTLTARAAERLDIKTEPAREAQVAPRGGAGAAVPRRVIPYAALVYDLDGSTWTYTSPSPLTFVRHQVKVDYIAGELAVLSEGPPVGTPVVTYGAAELFGTEFGVGH
jgi:hypothetical protein